MYMYKSIIDVEDDIIFEYVCVCVCVCVCDRLRKREKTKS